MGNSINEQLSFEFESDCWIFKIKDQFDEKNSDLIKNKISDSLKECAGSLILDLNEVQLIRSSGLRVILFFAKEFKNQAHKFVLLYSKNDENQQVSQVLDISGFLKIVDLFPTKKEALDHCGKSSLKK